MYIYHYIYNFLIESFSSQEIPNSSQQSKFNGLLTKVLNCSQSLDISFFSEVWIDNLDFTSLISSGVQFLYKLLSTLIQESVW